MEYLKDAREESHNPLRTGIKKKTGSPGKAITRADSEAGSSTTRPDRDAPPRIDTERDDDDEPSDPGTVHINIDSDQEDFLAEDYYKEVPVDSTEDAGEDRGTSTHTEEREFVIKVDNLILVVFQFQSKQKPDHYVRQVFKRIGPRNENFRVTYYCKTSINKPQILLPLFSHRLVTNIWP